MIGFALSDFQSGNFKFTYSHNVILDICIYSYYSQKLELRCVLRLV